MRQIYKYFFYLLAVAVLPARASFLNLTYTGTNGSVGKSAFFTVTQPARVVFEATYMQIAPSCTGPCMTSSAISFDHRYATDFNTCITALICNYEHDGGLPVFIGDYPIGTYTIDADITLASRGFAVAATNWISLDLVVLSGKVQHNPEPGTWLLLSSALLVVWFLRRNIIGKGNVISFAWRREYRPAQLLYRKTSAE